jgi:uncharacterized protein YbaR (Trm112 family)
MGYESAKAVSTQLTNWQFMNSKKKSEIGLMAREALDVEVTRIAQEKLYPHGCDLAVYPVGDGIPRFVIEVQGGEIRIQSRFEFLPTLQLINPKRRRPDL